MSNVRRYLLSRLSDGRIHSGADIAVDLDVSRAAVAKQVAHLRESGWEIETTPTGYWLASGHRPLQRDVLEACIASVGDRVARFDLLEQVDSTSTHLARLEPPAEGGVQICIAEDQQSGRGRRGRGWHARPGASIAFSVGAVLPLAPSSLAGFSLAAGVTCAEALAAQGLEPVRVKWPNDLQVNRAKLGGILVEISGESGGPSHVILGVGVNHHLGSAVPDTGGEVTDIVRCAPELMAERSHIAGELMVACVRLLECFARNGLRPWLDSWRRFDGLTGLEVEVDAPGGPVHGIAIGVAEDGALRLRVADGERRFHSGEVSVRPTS